MGEERHDRVGSALGRAGADWAVLTTPEAVCYATGMVVPIETGPSPFAGGPTAAFVSGDGDATLLVSDREWPTVSGPDDGIDVVLYEGYSWDRPLKPVEHYRAALSRLLDAWATPNSTVGIEDGRCPGVLARSLGARALQQVDIGPALASVRSTKTPGEIGRLRRAAELTALGHRAVHLAAVPGATEIEVFSAGRLAWETASGRRHPTMGELLSGRKRTSEVIGTPTDRKIALNEPVIADLVPRIDGYWGDTCSTIFVGTPSTTERVMFDAVRSALEEGAHRLRPGAVAADVDAAMRGVLARSGFAYQHHGGHGLGTSVHESPRIVPGDRTPIEPGMVVSLEPGAYGPEIGGVRLEWTFLVQADGCEPLGPMDEVFGRLRSW